MADREPTTVQDRPLEHTASAGSAFQPTYRSIWGVSYPLILAGLSETIVEVTDTLFLARYGVTELAAIGLADAIYGLALFVTLGLVDGMQITIGRRIGQAQPLESGRVFNQGLYLLALTAAAMIVFIKLAVPAMIEPLFASAEVHAAVDAYLQIAAFSLLFHSCNLALSAFYVGISRTRVLIGATVVLAVSNIVLDYTLIFGHFGLPELGIQGAAVSLVVAEIAAFLFLGWDVLRQRYALTHGIFRFGAWDGGLSRRLVTLSTPVSLEALVGMAKWFLFFLIIEQLGEGALASANIVFACYALFLIPIGGFSEATCSMTSNLIGQARAQRLAVLLSRTVRLGYAAVMPLLTVTLLFPDLVLSVFTPDAEMIDASLNSILVVALATLIIVPAETLYAAVAGTGDTRAILVIQSIVTTLTLVWAYYAALQLGLALEYVWLAEAGGALVCLLLSWAWLRSGLWERLKI